MPKVFSAAQGGIAFDDGDFDDVGDERSNAIDVALDAVERGVGVGGSAGELDRELEAGERGAELVGDVAEEAALADDEAFEAFGHLVEGAAELADFVGAAGADAGSEIALAEARDGIGDALDGKDDAGGCEPAKHGGGADDEIEVGQEGPDVDAAEVADGGKPVLAIRRNDGR